MRPAIARARKASARALEGSWSASPAAWERTLGAAAAPDVICRSLTFPCVWPLHGWIGRIVPPGGGAVDYLGGNRSAVALRLESPPRMATVSSQPGVGPLLREWRKRRRLSQLELALDAGISARHLSFVETGRSKPGRRDGAAARRAARGPVPGAQPAAARRRPRPGLPRALAGGPRAGAGAGGARPDPHRPRAVPGDRRSTARWNIVAANSAMLALAEWLDPALLEPPRNVQGLVMRLAPLIVNLGEVRAYFLERIERQARDHRGRGPCPPAGGAGGLPGAGGRARSRLRGGREGDPDAAAASRPRWRRAVVLRHGRHLRHSSGRDDFRAFDRDRRSPPMRGPTRRCGTCLGAESTDFSNLRRNL